MRNVIGPIAVGLLITATGCIETNGYPTSYGYQPYAGTSYYGRPTYYSPPVYQAPVQTRYVAVPAPSYPVYAPAYVAPPVPRPPHHHHHRPVRRDWDG